MEYTVERGPRPSGKRDGLHGPIVRVYYVPRFYCSGGPGTQAGLISQRTLVQIQSSATPISIYR